MTRRSAFHTALAIGLILACLPARAADPEAKSVAVAKQLTQALAAKKLDAIAARYPSEPDRFVAALYFPNVQLLVISGKYSAPQLMDPRFAAKQYRDIYTEISGTAPKDSKIFVQDLGTPGLTPKKTDALYDTWSQGDKTIMFDGDWDKQKISETDYQKAFAAADEEYTKILTALLAEAKS